MRSIGFGIIENMILSLWLKFLLPFGPEGCEGADPGRNTGGSMDYKEDCNLPDRCQYVCDGDHLNYFRNHAAPKGQFFNDGSFYLNRKPFNAECDLAHIVKKKLLGSIRPFLTNQ